MTQGSRGSPAQAVGRPRWQRIRDWFFDFGEPRPNSDSTHWKRGYGLDVQTRRWGVLLLTPGAFSFYPRRNRFLPRWRWLPGNRELVLPLAAVSSVESPAERRFWPLPMVNPAADFTVKLVDGKRRRFRAPDGIDWVAAISAALSGKEPPGP